MFFSMTNELKTQLLRCPRSDSARLTTQQIGRLGELLVQIPAFTPWNRLCPMTTDAGIDLVAYSGEKGRSFTIQVKTNLAAEAGGGRARQPIDWWVSEDCPAEFYAFVDLSTRRVWLLTKQELETSAQQRSGGTAAHIYVHKR